MNKYELEEFSYVKQEYCSCSKENICEFCFYGACLICIKKENINPYCDCSETN